MISVPLHGGYRSAAPGFIEQTGVKALLIVVVGRRADSSARSTLIYLRTASGAS